MWPTVITIASVTIVLAAAEPSHTVFSTITNSESGELDISYPQNVHSERGLPVCTANAACSVLHRRFWLKVKVERLCRCPEMFDCPRTWSQGQQDNRTMILNNRSQLKFCRSVTEFPECNARRQAITVINQTSEVQTGVDQSAVNTNVSVVATCYCPPHNYWKLHREPQNEQKKAVYRCVKLRKCAPMEFCGHVRADHYSTYYRCSCPMGHLCLFVDRSLHKARELLYTGPAYKGVCYPH